MMMMINHGSTSFMMNRVTTRTLLTALCIAVFMTGSTTSRATATGLKSFSVSKYLEQKRRQQQQQQKHHKNSFTADHSVTSAGNDTSDVQELFLEQKLDHFSSSPSSIGRTYLQRYFYTDRYVNPIPTTATTSSRTRVSNAPPQNAKYNLRHNVNHNQHHKHQHQHHYEDHENNNKEKKVVYAFLCMGGEGPSLTKSVLVDSAHCTGDMIELASILFQERNDPTNNNTSSFDVHLYALEHRYYGSSYPNATGLGNDDSPVSNENLKYLSSRQALADMAHFVAERTEFIKNRRRNDERVKVEWIAFGGSYPGMLAAWARSKYPHLIYGAVSNSAPLQVVLDFNRYKEVLGEDIKGLTGGTRKDEDGKETSITGGSEECWNVVKEGHEEIRTLLETFPAKTENGTWVREKVAGLFDICGGREELEVERNVQSFLGDGVIDIDVQDNDPHCDEELCNIKKLCTNLTTSQQTPMETLATISRAQSPTHCKNINWEEMISYLSSDEAKEGGTRSWLYQTCTEVGFYQTCKSNTTCPFSGGGMGKHHDYHNTIEPDLEICERAFGMKDASTVVAENVRATLEYYGGWDVRSSRILSVNGDVDPWSAMSLNVKMDSEKRERKQRRKRKEKDGEEDEIDDDDDGSERKADLPTYWSYGTSHHFWTHELKKNDGSVIMTTRKVIYDWVIGLMDGFEKVEEDEELLVDYQLVDSSTTSAEME